MEKSGVIGLGVAMAAWQSGGNLAILLTVLFGYVVDVMARKNKQEYSRGV